MTINPNLQPTVYTENFIGVFEDAFDKEYCDRAIQYFNDAEASGFVKTRLQRNDYSNKLDKDDTALFLNDVDVVNMRGNSSLTNIFLNKFWTNLFPLYGKETYSALTERTTDQLVIEEMKIQKTGPGQGYHAWHYETSKKSHANRVLVYQLYLNDVESGGETEFLYLRQRLTPKRGTLVVWPAGFTHLHRGNPPLSGDKYILSGWVVLS
jgi:hypothetical protein